MRKPTLKTWQSIWECECGCVEVSQIETFISFKQMRAFGVKRKKDKKTGSVFYVKHTKNETCDCNELPF